MKREEEKQYTKTEIDQLLEKGHRFLRCIGRTGAIRKILKDFGYTKEEHERGWELYLGLMGYKEEATPTALRDEAALEAEAALKGWVKANFPKGRAALRARYPDQGDFLFQGIEGKMADKPLGSVPLYLKRIETLRSGSAMKRKEQREEDLAAVKLLETRHLAGAEEEERLWRWFREMTKLPEGGERGEKPLDEGETPPREGKDEPPPSPNVLLAEAKEQAQIKAFVLWLDDWRTTAKTEIKRRDYLISLGFASRRKISRGKAEEETERREEEKPR